MMLIRLYILFVAGMTALSIGARGADEAAATNAVSSSATTGFNGSAGSNGPSGTTFDNFRILSERNIFNQNRSPRTARRETERTRRTPVVQSLSLVGTLSYEKGDFAFFDGSKPEFKKPVKAGEKIAGYEVKEISPSCVKIGNEAQQFEMKVGQQLRKEDEGEWRLASSQDRVPASSSGSNETRSSSSEATSSSGGASEEEALKRLMEKRAKEMKE